VQDQEVAADGVPIVKLSDIVLDQYQVLNVDSEELFQLARTMISRDYYIAGGGNDVYPNMRLLGTKIVLYDTAEQVKRMKEMLARLDAPYQDRSPSSKSVEYRPRFLSLKTAESAVEDRVDVKHIPERGLLVLNGEPESVEAALALLKRVDVPEKQVLLTCQLVEVGGTPQGPPLPRELVDNLQKLLPGSQFTQTGMAMLKSSVGGQSVISLRIESQNQDYRLTFTPVAFDETTGSLTISECRLRQAIASDERELFCTNTVLHGGEYTVLAATGATPRLLVLRVTPQE